MRWSSLQGSTANPVCMRRAMVLEDRLTRPLRRATTRPALDWPTRCATYHADYSASPGAGSYHAACTPSNHGKPVETHKLMRVKFVPG